MSFPGFAAYKNGGPLWLGDIPAHWSLVPLWTQFRRVKRVGFDAEPLLSVYRDHGVVPKASRDDNFNKASDDLSVYQLVIPGDLVINKMKAWQGSVAISEHRGIVSPAYFVYQALHAANHHYLHYLLRSLRYITGFLSMSKGIRVNQWDLDSDLLSSMPLLIPPLAEQEAITSFLDIETGKIDALVLEQHRLIVLLEEKRHAMISNAVTHGLQQDVTIAESGVEWLGEVPAHWKKGRVKTVSSFITSGPRGWSESISDQGALFVQSGDLNDAMEVSFGDSKRVQVVDDAETARTLLCDGDVVVCITGAKTGNVAVCSTVPEPAYINQHLCLLRPNPAVLPMFLGIWLKSNVGQTYFELSQYGLKQGLSLEDVKEAPVYLPPIDEQREIVEYVIGETERIGLLIAEAERAISLFDERRKALISAAVTGQIDLGKLQQAVAA